MKVYIIFYVVCCIYHKPRKPGEVDSDSETSSESEDDEAPNQYERQPRYIRKKMAHKKHHHHGKTCYLLY